MINEKKDACYHKVKSRYSVWPSAYASGALVKCRKKGAKNWGNSRKDEALHTAYFNFAASLVNEDAIERAAMAAKAKADKEAAAKKEAEREAKERAAGTSAGREDSNAAAAQAKPKETPKPKKSFFRRTLDKYSIDTDPDNRTDYSGEERRRQPRQDDLRAELERKRAEERTARAASRGTSRKATDFRIVNGRIKTIQQGLLARKDGKIGLNRAAFTRGEGESRGKAITRGLLGTLPARRLRGDAERLKDKGIIKSVYRRAKGGIARGRAAMKARRERIDFSTEYQKIGSIIAEKSAAWTRSEGKNPSGGLNAKGVASYRAQNPGSKLKTAVTTKPSKLKKGSKAAKRRKSFCARMKGMRKRQKSSNNTGKDRLSLSLKKWNC